MNTLTRLRLDSYQTRAVAADMVKFALPQLSARLQAAKQPLAQLLQLAPSQSSLQNIVELYDRSSVELLQLANGDPDQIVPGLRGVRNQHNNVIADIAECFDRGIADAPRAPVQRGIRDVLRLRVGFHTLISHCVASDSEDIGRVGVLHAPLDLEHVVPRTASLCDRWFALFAAVVDGVTGAGAALVAAACFDGLQVQSAAQDAEHLCDRVYGEAPEVRIESSREHTINYMQQHVYFVVLSFSVASLSCNLHSSSSSNFSKMR